MPRTSSPHHRADPRRRSPRSRRFVARHVLLIAALVLAGIALPLPTRPLPLQQTDQPVVLAVQEAVAAGLEARSRRADDLTWLRPALGAGDGAGPPISRSDLIHERQRLLADGDASGAARHSAVLAAEAQIRANGVLARWRTRLDPETGLLPKGTDDEDRFWDYADAGADLFPHLLIAVHLLAPDAVPLLTGVITGERRLGGGGLPSNVDLVTNKQDPRRRDRMYGAVEYAKDGLLPLTERLGPGPWLDRMREIVDAVTDASSVQTRFGPIPSEEAEVNGQALQVYCRLYWVTGDARYLDAASRIARAYLDLALADTDWVPTRTWDFERERANTSAVQLRDHGNEIIAGLVEYHLIESSLGRPEAGEHRRRIRAMLDRLLVVGRDGDGRWQSAIDLKTGDPTRDTLSDNWGYLYAAYLTQATIEERWPGDDPVAAQAYADRYRVAVREGMLGVSRLDLYPWQGTEQDGYADTIESALYLLNRVDVPEATGWTDRQAGTLFGAQAADGRVEDRYLDGNFVRTALLYAAWHSAGTRLAPWTASATVGAARDGDCLVVAALAGRRWQGKLLFDRPRHAEHLRLPINYPRLNEWPEWFTVEPGRQYVVTLLDRSQRILTGQELATGLPLVLEPGREQHLRVCAS